MLRSKLFLLLGGLCAATASAIAAPVRRERGEQQEADKTLQNW